MKKIALLATALLFLTVACKKTVESETKTWARNLKNIEKLAYEYSNFKTSLQEVKKKAEVIMKSAEAITKEEDKLKKMEEANQAINALFVRNLGDIKSKIQSLKDKVVDARGLKMEMNERYSVKRAISDADRAIMDAQDKIQQSVDSIIQAETLTEMVISDLKSALSGLDRVVSRVEERIAAEKKIEDEKKQVVQKQEEIKKELAKPVKCPYCGTTNLPGRDKCKNCGAPLPKNKI